jgi:flagellar hook-basal body complex protein FliE
MIAVEQADISLRMLVQMRNKALTAYEEIMRMQI